MFGTVGASKPAIWSRRSAAISSACLVFLLFAPLRLAAQGPIAPASANCTGRDLVQTAYVGSYLFKAYKNKENGTGCLEVLLTQRGGRLIGRFIPKVVFRSTLDGMGEFRLGQPVDPARNIPGIRDGADITGRGRANMIVTNWTGGAHCCFSHFVFEVEPALWLLAKIDDGDGDEAHFADLDGNHSYYYLGNDWTFSYWNASFAASPAPTVVLHFVEDAKTAGYRLAMDKMQRPAPTPAEWEKAVREASDAISGSNGIGDGIGSELWSNMLNLIYTGHSDLAWQLVDQAWPHQKPGKDKFLSGFCSQLKTSPYWPQIEPTIFNTPPACTASAP